MSLVRLIVLVGVAALAVVACGRGSPDPTPSAPAPWSLVYLAPGHDGRGALPFTVDSFGALYMDWNPDRTALVYVYRGDLWLWQHGTETNLTNTADRIEGLPRWSPDGRWIAFASRPYADGESHESLVSPPGVLSVISMQTAEPSRYSTFGTGMLRWPPSWSPDGTRIAVVERGEVHVYTLGGQVSLAHTAPDLHLGAALSAVEWSPRDDVLLVAFAEPEDAELAEGVPARIGYAVVTLDGTAGWLVMDWHSRYVPAPPARWSPDGRRILVTLPAVPASLAPDYPTGLWVIERGDPEPLAGEPSRGPGARQAGTFAPYQARWSPDGLRIGAIDEGERALVILDVVSLEVLQWTDAPRPVEGFAW